jgi:hypothetical protein
MTAAVMGMPPTSRYGVAFGDANDNDSRRSNGVLESFFSGWENVFCAPRSIETYSKEVAEEPDVLDYVFDHVESFTCVEESSYQNDPFFHGNYRDDDDDGSKNGSFGYNDNNDLSFKRENSLVEQGPNGAPAYLATTRQPIGQEGDLLDYCFEHVESFVCNTNDGEEGDYGYDDQQNHQPQSKKSKSSTHHRTPMRNTTNQQQQQQRSQRNRSSTLESSHPIPRVISTPRNNKKKNRRERRQKQNHYPDEEDNILLYYRPMKAH